MDQTILITGASRGIGAAAARWAGELGANLVLAARSSGPLEQTAEIVRQKGGRALVVRADLSSEADCQAIVHRAIETFGRIDALVNNSAVIEPMGPVAEARPDDWRYNWEVNLLGPVMLSKYALPYLRVTGGCILNISSGAAQNVIGGWGAYSSTKAAINQLSRVMAIEEPQVTVIALRPGIVDTQMQATIRDKGKPRMAEPSYNWLSGLHAQGQLLSPDAPGKAIACLALFAPHAWSGEVMQWDEPHVQELVAQHFSPAGA